MFRSLWLTPMYTYVGHWIWGGWLCHGLPLFQGTSIFISTLTLMAIAMDRYFVIVHHSSSVNINDRMSMRTCILVVTLIWLLSLLLVMPYAYHMRLTFITEPCNFWVCGEDWSMKRIKSIYGVIVMALQFIVPFVIIGISYHSIWSFLNGRRRLTRERAVETNRYFFEMLSICNCFEKYTVGLMHFIRSGIKQLRSTGVHVCSVAKHERAKVIARLRTS
ncbi:hypothetical protein ANCCAN_01301 [Ancylostoma caninum]|uniref:G-protein coupled receptors family 1 profile domain-containing protein n=1 Tax=Ancylostoma caninum TaxID=29170 RepID=A0A368H7N7_ANCCA|nr:hypothetical protein ANCCAN_01301 [Ancylostoma caninum]